MKNFKLFTVFVLVFSSDIISQENTNTVNNCFQIISGTVRQKSSNKNIKNATVELFKNNNLIKKVTTNSKGAFNIKVGCQESYYLVAYKTKYTKTKKSFTTSNVSNLKIEVTVYINQKKSNCTEIFNGKVHNEFDGNPIGNVTVQVKDKNDNLFATEITNSNGNYHFSLPCNKTFIVIYSKKEYIDTTTEIKTGKNNKRIQRRDITFHLKSIKNIKISQKVSKDIITAVPIKQQTKIISNNKKEVTIEVNNFIFELNSSKITKTIAIELDKIVGLMMISPNLKVELNSHTDSRGPDEFNLSLSEARAQSMISYLINNGIDTSRVSGKGYGETKLLHNCGGEKRCTESEHQQNKRIEVIFLD